MNFFRKGQTAFISLTAQDLQLDPLDLADELNYVFEGGNPLSAKIRLHECSNISLKSLSVIAGLALRLKETGAGLELEAPRQLLAMLRKLHLSDYFKVLNEVG